MRRLLRPEEEQKIIEWILDLRSLIKNRLQDKKNQQTQKEKAVFYNEKRERRKRRIAAQKARITN